ncbi:MULTISPECIES: hypothetical protein [Streptomyces]|uniref:hypothetical protein n=1 Tax=Streptomyces TaxID=1883 RepID=UPI0002D40ED0|nr:MULTISPECIES: hypothetical protein [Streptomyces]AZK95701.1 hypothetical protein B7R87_18920 [Streptomyces tsukubensis]MYS68357.1 hypothetical protein [Streptomyces sp. SID5473]
MNRHSRLRGQTRDPDALADLLTAGGFWGLAPAWVPRAGYVRDRDTLIRCRAGLVRILQGESISARRRYGRGH